MPMSDMHEKLRQFRPPAGWIKVTTIDAHTEGEPLRIMVAGYPELEGETILERRRDALENYDRVRKILMWEPRGHADMYGCVVTPPVTENADFGVLFLHNEGYSSMCGHGIIAITKVAVETGMVDIVEPETTVRIDTPAGLVRSYAKVEDGRCKRVRFLNVPSFVDELDAKVDVPGIGEVRYDLAFGGAYYAYVNAADFGLTCAPEEHTQLIDVGMRIKRAIMTSRQIVHPTEPDLNFLYGTIFIAPPLDDNEASADNRNVCVFAEGEVDRSPTGTGVSGRVAIHYARDEIKIGEPTVIESIIGSRFTAKVVEETKFGPHNAIIPEVSGRAFITGRHEFVIDPEDPLGGGFILR